MAEPTSVLTFSDLIIEVARKIGVAYYGATGDEAPQVPVDAHDLAECQRHVNNAIRMFLADGPQPNGWNFTKPTASITLWPSVNITTGQTISFTSVASGISLLTATADVFYDTMEEKEITITGSGTYTITEYVSATQIRVNADLTGLTPDTFSITSDANYTLPRGFSGQYTGAITYAASTNQGVNIRWGDEGLIRQWRENITNESGDPWVAAVRPKAGDPTSPRRRWELMAYPNPDEVMTLEFPYVLHFDTLTSLTEVPPIPFSHDDSLLTACKAIAERDVEGSYGVDWNDYRSRCLPNSFRIDAMSRPKKLGSFRGDGRRTPRSITDFRENFENRPNVQFNP